ncbi:hypothetical protein PMAYCL1PPCAC_29271 [Pristionchus mayeri]|uniref:ribonuclease H n=1 Tax=Pristionchus mayeri TaxID=1317129 RepID=A0AAN5D966_9BILA|nr:hypothetical protein PMAYCL1PPCAC_29271 [Pristionchus mayeri]
MVYSLLKLTFHRLVRFSLFSLSDIPTDPNTFSEHSHTSQLVTSEMSKQFTSILRTPAVSRSMVELPTTSTNCANAKGSRMASSDPISNSRSWMFSPSPTRRGRDMTRRCVIRSAQLQRSDSLPPASHCTPSLAPSTHFSPNAPIVAYTDASCVDGRASGMGVFFGDGHPLNISRALAGPEHNSGIAEIMAAQTALASILEWKEFKGQPVVIRTDYIGVIDAMNNGNYGRFAGLYADLRRLAERFPSVRFEHVYGHDGERGNEMADRLARDAIRLRRRSATPDGRKGERTRSRSREGRSRSATINGNMRDRKSPPKVSDPSKVPPPDPNRSRSRSRSRSRNRKNLRAEVMAGVRGESSRPSRSVRSMRRSVRENTQRSQRQSQRSTRSTRRNGRR